MISEIVDLYPSIITRLSFFNEFTEAILIKSNSVGKYSPVHYLIIYTRTVLGGLENAEVSQKELIKVYKDFII